MPDLANNSVTVNEIANGVYTSKNDSSVALGVWILCAKDGSVNGNASGRDNLFRVNLNATTGNVTIVNNNASVTNPIDNW